MTRPFADAMQRRTALAAAANVHRDTLNHEKMSDDQLEKSRQEVIVTANTFLQFLKAEQE